MVQTLKKRAQFLALRNSPAVGRPGFLLVRGHCADRKADNLGKSRIGFTVTKKMGNAVVRNRIRRRLKAVINHAAPLLSADQADYVVIARSGAKTRSFDALCHDMQQALTRLQQDRHKDQTQIEKT